jgi:hypothetical protein
MAAAALRALVAKSPILRCWRCEYVNEPQIEAEENEANKLDGQRFKERLPSLIHPASASGNRRAAWLTTI